MTDSFPVLDAEVAYPETAADDLPVSVPCTIYVDFPPPLGSVFEVKDIGAWQHTDEGIFATGCWQRQPGGTAKPAVDILIPYHSVRYIQFDFDALMTFREDADDA